MKVSSSIAMLVPGLCILAGPPALLGQAPAPACTLETQGFRWVVGSNGQSLSFADKASGVDYLAAPSGPMAQASKAGQTHPCTSASFSQGRLVMAFGGSGIEAILTIRSEPHHLILEVVSVTGEPETLTFVDIPLRLRGKLDEPFAATLLALNLQTDVPALPGPSARLKATAYARFGFASAQVALIACPPEALREAMKTVVQSAKDLPQSNIGGPWALDAKINRGSYLFDFGACTEKTVQDWIKLAKSLGINQIDFHTGTSLRFGDCAPNPELFPRGMESVKAVIDQLHQASISAGLHTYAFFIAKNTPYVSPVPDPRLGKDKTFTLAEDLSSDRKEVPVQEPTDSVSTVTGFFVRNSVTVQIDEELITYADVAKEAPYGFKGCVRGALGTRAAEHKRGAPVHHLKECFGLFCPDADSTLLAEVAANTAKAFNDCGFDMIYLDALDGEDILAGAEFSWHYGSKFAFEIAKRLNRPALFEMSTFHHHLWFIRARMGAWDHPSRSHKRFIDVHCAANEEGRGMFLPMSLGWWAVKSWDEGPFGTQVEPTFQDDIEYLLCKCLGYDWGFALMGVDPQNIATVPAFERLAPLFRQYEELRHAGAFSESVRARLRAPGEEFALEKDGSGAWRFRPVNYDRHKVQGMNESREWTSRNPFGSQAPRLRIQCLMSVQSYDSPESTVVEDFSSPDALRIAAAEGVQAALSSTDQVVKVSGRSGCYTATSEREASRGAWSQAERAFTPALNLAGKPALGVWVHGDGQGELLNIQWRSPEHTTFGGIGDHYIEVNFTGWRYFELVEPEGGHIEDFSWPYGGSYGIYRETVDPAQVAKVSFWYNALPKGKPVTCHLSPLKALPVAKGKIVRPRVAINDRVIEIPVTIESGCVLEMAPGEPCRLVGPKGELIQSLDLSSEWPTLAPGDNSVRFSCEDSGGLNPRAAVTVISRGDPLP